MPEKIEYHKRILYLGLDPSRFKSEGEVVHLPIIKIAPRSFFEVKEVFMKMDDFTHLLFTSRTAVSICIEYAHRAGVSLAGKKIFALGRATAEKLAEFDMQADRMADDACGEGVIALLKSLDLSEAHLFFPHSALSRKIIHEDLEARHVRFTSCVLYTTVTNPLPLPAPLESFDEVIFTSPSTVKAFRELFACLPSRHQCRAIGPITEKHFNF